MTNFNTKASQEEIINKINNMKQHILRVQAQTPIKTMQVKSEEGKQTAVCTLMVQELGGKWADSLAVQLYGDMAQKAYQPGELIVAALRFKARPVDAERIFQDVTADEIVRLNEFINPIINNNKNEEETLF